MHENHTTASECAENTFTRRWQWCVMYLLAGLVIFVFLLGLTVADRMDTLAENIETELHKASTYYSDLCEVVEVTEKEMIFLSKESDHYFAWWLEPEENYRGVKGKRFTVWFDGLGTETRTDDVIIDFEIVQ